MFINKFHKALFSILMIGILIISGCASGGDNDVAVSGNPGDELSATDNPELDSAESQTYYTFDNTSSMDDFLDQVEEIPLGDNTLLIYTQSDYSNAVITELNKMLTENGYDFDTVVCRIPDNYLYDGDICVLTEEMQKRNVPADSISMYYQDHKICAQENLFIDFTNLLETDGENALLSCMPDKYTELANVDGAVYGIGNVRPPQNSAWSVNQELMDKYGLETSEFEKSIPELENVLENIYTREGTTCTPFGFSVYSLFEYIPFTFVDSSCPIGYWTEDDQCTVVNLFETDEMYEIAAAMNNYYEKGYLKNIYDTSLDKCLLSFDFNGFPNYTGTSTDNSSGEAIEMYRIGYYNYNTAMLRKPLLNAIPSWSTHKEDAFSFLSFVFQNKDAANLLRFGIEDSDYRITDGYVELLNNRTQAQTYSDLGNIYISSPLAGEETNSRLDQANEMLAETESSKLYGFAFDSSGVQNEMIAVQEIFCNYDMYYDMFMYTASPNQTETSWEECYNEFVQALRNAGIQNIVDEMNRQIQEYILSEN